MNNFRSRLLAILVCCTTCAPLLSAAEAKAPASQPAGSFSGSSTVTRIYALKFANAEATARLLRQALPEDCRIVAMAGSVIVTGPAGVSSAVEEILAKADTQESQTADTQIQVFALTNGNAEETCKAVSRIVGSELRCQPDSRTNSAILTGTKAQLQTAARLIEDLDRRDTASPADSRMVRIFQLKNTKVDPGIIGTLTMLVGNGSVSTDPAGNQIIVRGDERSLRSVAEVLKAIDIPQEKLPISESRPVRVRLVWLSQDENGSPPPQDLGEVIAELGKIGVSHLRLVAQTVVATTAGPGMETPAPAMGPMPGPPQPPPRRVAPTGPSDSFSVKVATDSEARCQLSLDGKFLPSPGDTPKLAIVLELTGAVTKDPNSQQRMLCSINSTICAPIGNSVVLGVTPIGKQASVFVLQLLPQ